MVEPCYIKGLQKQPFTDVLQNRCSLKFSKIRRKTNTLESLFSKVAGLERLNGNFLPMIFATLSRTPYNKIS